MYTPAIFQENRIDVLHELMRAHPFATLISVQDFLPAADHIPLVLHPTASENGTLRGHIAKQNPLWELRREEIPQPVLAVFHGPQTYITPSWYPSKQAHGKVVPTWNYVVVHAHGYLHFRDDAAWILEHLKALTRQHEKHQRIPWDVGDAPDDFIERQLAHIVGFEIPIAQIIGKWKVSQNRSDPDRAGVEAGLRAEDDPNAQAIEHLMRNGT